MMVSLRIRFISALMLSGAWVLLAAQGMGQPRFRITNLGAPPHGGASFAYGLNAKGQIVGQFFFDDGEDPANHAFIWLPEADYGLSAGMHDLTILADLAAPGKDGIAFDINDDGIVAGRQGGLTGLVQAVAFVWDLSKYPNSGWAYDLGSLGSGGSWDRFDEGGAAYAISNADPAVVVGEAGEVALGFQVTLGSEPAIVDLAPLDDDPEDDCSCGRDVNMSVPVLVVGSSNPFSGGGEDCMFPFDGVVWNDAGDPRPATELAGFGAEPDYPRVLALGANEAGLIVGWGYEETGEPEPLKCRSRALFWEKVDDHMVKFNLGALVTGSPDPNESEAEAIRNTTEYEPFQVVGQDVNANEALLWERDGDNWTLTILNDEIGGCYPARAQLYVAKDINDNGWITGWGQLKVSGVWDWRAYVLTHPGDCPADVNGDGKVNIDDLFEVLNHWGDPLPGVIWIWDVNFDCIVDIDDVFAVMAAWGDCAKGDGGGEGRDLADILTDWLDAGGAAALDKDLITWDDILLCLNSDFDAEVQACLYGLLKE
jgi:hypothetical protein